MQAPSSQLAPLACCAVCSSCCVTTSSSSASTRLCAWEVGAHVDVLTTRDIVFVRTGAKRAGAGAPRCAVCCACYVAASSTASTRLCAWEVRTRVNVLTAQGVIFVSAGGHTARAGAPGCAVGGWVGQVLAGGRATGAVLARVCHAGVDLCSGNKGMKQQATAAGQRSRKVC